MTGAERRKVRVVALKRELKVMRHLETQVYCYFFAKSTQMTSREIRKTIKRLDRVRAKCRKMLADAGGTYD